MCLPAAAIVGLAGGALGAYGQVQAGNQNNAIAKANANNLDLSASDAEQRARLDGEIIRQQVGQTIGQQRAGFSAANVDISSGSAANLSVDTAGAGELELMRTLNNAAREAYGLRSQAAVTRQQGKYAQRMGYLGGAATLLGSASDAFGMKKGLSGGGPSGTAFDKAIYKSG